MESILTMGHQRLNNKSIWSVKYNNQQSWGENLAWNNNSDSIYMINQWYDEKKDWVTGGKGVTGHYESIISTRYKYAGLGWFKGTSGKYGMCLCGQFSDVENLTEGFLDEEIDISQKVDISKNLIKDYFLDIPDSLYVGQKEKIIPRVNIKADGICPLWILENESKDYTYTSSDKTIISINGKDNNIEALKSGKVTITCKRKDKSLFAKKEIKVFSEKELKNQKIDFSFFWKNIQTNKDGNFWSSVPESNPIGSKIVCWNHSKLKNLIIEISDENLLKISDSSGDFINMEVLGSGDVTLTAYIKNNPFVKEIINIHLGE